MRTSEECRAKAEEFERRASEAVPGPVQETLADMAAVWRRLGSLAQFHETIEAHACSDT